MRITLTAILALMAAPAFAEPVTVNYWAMWNEDEPVAKVLAGAIAEFEAANPDINVEVNWAGRDVRKLILPALESGQAVDVFENGSDWLMGADRGENWLKLDAYLDAPGAYGGPSLRSELVPGILSQFATAEGTFLVPEQPFSISVFYSQDAFDKAGITAAPATWAEMIEASKKLVAAGYEPMTMDPDAYVSINFAYPALRALGSCDALNATIADKTGEAWKAPEILAMAEDMVAAREAGMFSANMPGNRYPAGQQDVALGSVAMILNGSWLPTELSATSGPDFKWGAFNYPLMTAGKGGAGDVMMGSQGFAIPKGSKVPDQAFALIAYLSTKAVQDKLVSEANTTSARVDATWPANIASVAGILGKAERGIGWACDIESQGDIVKNVVFPTFTDLLNGKLDAASYVAAMAEGSAKFHSGQ